MQNEKLSSLTKEKTKTNNTGQDQSNKAQINAQNLNTDSKKVIRNSGSKKRKRKKQKPISSAIHRLFKPELFFQNYSVMLTIHD